MTTVTPFQSAGLATSALHLDLGHAVSPKQGMVNLDCLIIGSVEDDAAAQVATVTTPAVDKLAPSTVLDEVVTLFERAKEAQAAGDLAALKGHLLKVVELDPDNGLAHFNLGVLFRDARSYLPAETHLRRAVNLDPKNPLYHLALGELMQIMRHLIFAAEAYEKGLEVDPNHKTILANLTEVRLRQRIPQQVVELSRRLLALDPQAQGGMIALTTALLWLGQTEEAVEVAERAYLQDPKSIHAAALFQAALKRSGNLDKANAILAVIEKQSLALWENCSRASETLLQVDEGETSAHLLRQVIAQRPNFVPALQQLGRYAIMQGDVDEGFALMSRVVELNPEEGDAQTSVSLTLIRNGQYEEGWARHHWRWKRTGCEPRWDLPLADWDGKQVDGGLILWREQGIGDMVMYAAPAIACRPLAKHIALETNLRLRTLLQRSFPDMSVVCREDMPADFFAKNNIVAHCPNGDLPHLLKLDMEHFPGREGFLIPHPVEVRRLRDRYQLMFPGKRLIGISWRSGNSASAILRSIDLQHWMPLFETEDCAFISLQYGDISKDVDRLREETGVEVYIDPEVDAMLDMDRFAAQIGAVDLVISVDNSTVHVAGALGKETWAFIPAASDWRWLTPDRTDTVWYRSVSLLRRKTDSDWKPQIEAAASRLHALSQETIVADRIAFCLRCAEQAIQFGDFNTAELYYRQVLLLKPDAHTALAGLSQVALQTNHVAEAISLLRRACQAAPEVLPYHYKLIDALRIAGRLDQAYAVLRESVRLDSGNVALLGLGIEILAAMGNEEEVANYCARLLRLEPENREARAHLARMQIAAGDFDIAEDNVRRVLTAHPDDAPAAFVLGCLAFRREELAQGWHGFAKRFGAGLTASASKLDLPTLSLSGDQPDLSRERIAVRPEPGLKDQILFARWLARLRRDSDFAVAELDPRLIPMVDQSVARLSLFPTGSLQPEEAADLDLTCQITVGDLGARYGLEMSTLGAPVPYLQVDRVKAAAMRHDYLAALQTPKLVGLCWRGAELSIPLSEWLPILRLNGLGFVSLQAGPVQQELHDVFDGLGKAAIRDPAIDPQTNLRGFAAQIAAVDLVISIDEVPAHLAGALGVPVLCLLPQVADWRWFNDKRTDSPWYPTMQLYRQTTRGDWADVMARVSADLAAFAESNLMEKRDE